MRKHRLAALRSNPFAACTARRSRARWTLRPDIILVIRQAQSEFFARCRSLPPSAAPIARRPPRRSAAPRVWRWLACLLVVAVPALDRGAVDRAQPRDVAIRRQRDACARAGCPADTRTHRAQARRRRCRHRGAGAGAQGQGAPSKPREHVLTATRPGRSPHRCVSAAARCRLRERAARPRRSATAAAQLPRAAASARGQRHAAASAPPSCTRREVLRPAIRANCNTTRSTTAYEPAGHDPLDERRQDTTRWSYRSADRSSARSCYSSHGHVDAFGLAPDQYIEKRGHRAEDVSIFNRSTKQIVFTRTPASLPLTDGAQDRFSMVMQLASLVRGDPDAYKPGVTRQFFVVDNDSGEIWPFETIGDETIRTGRVTSRRATSCACRAMMATAAHRRVARAVARLAARAHLADRAERHRDPVGVERSTQRTGRQRQCEFIGARW